MVPESSATSPQSSVMSSTGSLCSIKSDTKSPFWLGTVFDASAYFGDVCAPVADAPGRTNLRSATRGDLLIPRSRTKLGERSFRVSAPTVWNSHPCPLKHSATSREHFRKDLKTYLFRRAYAASSENYLRENLFTYLLLRTSTPGITNICLHTKCHMDDETPVRCQENLEGNFKAMKKLKIFLGLFWVG